MISVLTLVLRFFRYALNTLDPWLRYINIRLVSTPSTVDELLERVRLRFGSLPTLASNGNWRERVQNALETLKGKELTPFGRWVGFQTLMNTIRASVFRSNTATISRRSDNSDRSSDIHIWPNAHRIDDSPSSPSALSPRGLFDPRSFTARTVAPARRR